MLGIRCENDAIAIDAIGWAIYGYCAPAKDTARRKDIRRKGAPALGKVIVILDFSSNPHDTPLIFALPGQVHRIDSRVKLSDPSSKKPNVLVIPEAKGQPTRFCPIP